MYIGYIDNYDLKEKRGINRTGKGGENGIGQGE